MGKTIYSRCVDLLKENFKKGEKIGSKNLIKFLMMYVGGQDRTIKNSIKVMLQTKLIKDIGNMHFKIL